MIGILIIDYSKWSWGVIGLIITLWCNDIIGVSTNWLTRRTWKQKLHRYGNWNARKIDLIDRNCLVGFLSRVSVSVQVWTRIYRKWSDLIEDWVDSALWWLLGPSKISENNDINNNNNNNNNTTTKKKKQVITIRIMTIALVGIVWLDRVTATLDRQWP